LTFHIRNNKYFFLQTFTHTPHGKTFSMFTGDDRCLVLVTTGPSD